MSLPRFAIDNRNGLSCFSSKFSSETMGKKIKHVTIQFNLAVPFLFLNCFQDLFPLSHCMHIKRKSIEILPHTNKQKVKLKNRSTFIAPYHNAAGSNNSNPASHLRPCECARPPEIHILIMQCSNSSTSYCKQIFSLYLLGISGMFPTKRMSVHPTQHLTTQEPMNRFS